MLSFVKHAHKIKPNNCGHVAPAGFWKSKNPNMFWFCKCEQKSEPLHLIELLGAPSGVHHSKQQAEPATRHTAVLINLHTYIQGILYKVHHSIFQELLILLLLLLLFTQHWAPTVTKDMCVRVCVGGEII